MNAIGVSIIGDGGGPYKTLKGAMDVHQADVHNVIVNDYLHRHGVDTTLAVAAVAGDTDIDVVSAAGFNVGDYIHFGPVPATLEPIHPQITAITVNNIVLDRPIDFNYANGSDITQSIINLSGAGSAVGTLAAPISYKYFPQAGRVEHIDRIILSMTHTAAASDDKLGGIAALTSGLVFRAQVGGQLGTFTNWKANSDIILDVFDVVYSDKAGPSLFGTSARGAFSELEVTIALDGDVGDFLEILVQDDLTALTSLRIKAQGHVEGV